MAKQEEVLKSIVDAEMKSVEIPESLTVLPLREMILFPNMIFPVLIGRTSSLKAIAKAIDNDKFIFLSSQKDSNIEEPTIGDINEYGTIGKIIQVLRLPNNLLKVLIEGMFHAKIKKPIENGECMEALIEQIPVKYNERDKDTRELIHQTGEIFKEYVFSKDNLPPDLVSAFDNIDDPVRKMYYAAANMQADIREKQRILNHRFLKSQYTELLKLLTAKIELSRIQNQVGERVSDSIQKTQRAFYIREQIKALQKELGEDEEAEPEIEQLRKMLDEADLPKHAREKADEELNRLRKTPQMSPEFSVNRNFLELMAQLPWNKASKDNLDINHVQKVLDEDHYDLEKPKERITEFISVLNLAGALKRQIICFVGPPGVGKTSLAKSIARALDREFVRFSLGGVRDEAEIRGHRRTYIGSMPGKIIQSMKKAGTRNPVILLDEIDKLASDFRGDPASALLEVLDPEQNINFNDHYLEVDYDLSNVLFITTANVLHNIPQPLLDRMEVIQLTSYLDHDKLEIAKKHIIPKLIKEYGFDNIKIKFEDKAITRMITEYTREAGVRNLERTIANVFRKLAKEIVVEYGDKVKDKTIALKDNPEFKKKYKNKGIVITPAKVEDYLKAPKHKLKKEDLKDKVGVATGLAWTSTGGDLLPIEVNIMPSKSEKLTLTGKLGDVMKESGMAALSYVRANYKLLGVPEEFTKGMEIHIHVPEGAIPKDGPSAGITMCTALVSAATNKAVKGNVAMTGEITLRGNILPIGGLSEKLLAAKKRGIKKVLVPFDNKRDVEEIDEFIKKGLEIIFVEHITEALPHSIAKWTKK
ncbi:MAG: endopeptidase La [Candidatus Kapaibacterium sp.]